MGGGGEEYIFTKTFRGKNIHKKIEAIIMIMESKMYQDSFKNFQIMTLLMKSDQRKGILF